MKYQNLLKIYNDQNWDKTIFLFKSKKPKEFSYEHLYLVGFIDGDYIKTIGGLYSRKGFTKVRKARRSDLPF